MSNSNTAPTTPALSVSSTSTTHQHNINNHHAEIAAAIAPVSSQPSHESSKINELNSNTNSNNSSNNSTLNQHSKLNGSSSSYNKQVGVTQQPLMSIQLNDVNKENIPTTVAAPAVTSNSTITNSIRFQKTPTNSQDQTPSPTQTTGPIFNIQSIGKSPSIVNSTEQPGNNAQQNELGFNLVSPALISSSSSSSSSQAQSGASSTTTSNSYRVTTLASSPTNDTHMTNTNSDYLINSKLNESANNSIGIFLFSFSS